MILFLDEDRAYLHWVLHHRTGFVLDCLRHPRKTHLVLHRATCPLVKQAAAKRTHWTTGRHIKGCALELEELVSWAKDQTEHEPASCPQCAPREELEIEPHLTKLDRDLLDFVLEIAVSHFDDNDFAYALTVGMVARCLGKTEGQLQSAFGRLVIDELLLISGRAKPGEIPLSRSGVFPTAKALRTLPDFASLDDAQLEAELSKLRHE